MKDTNVTNIVISASPKFHERIRFYVDVPQKIPVKGKSFKVVPLDTKFRAEQVRPQNCMFQEASPRAIEWIITLASSTAFSQKLADHKS